MSRAGKSRPLLSLPLALCCCGNIPGWEDLPPLTTGASSTGESSTGTTGPDGFESTAVMTSVFGSTSGSGTTTTTTKGPDETGAAGTTGTTTTTGRPASTSGGEPFCGDGVVEGDEECDDGDLDFKNACNGFCKRERVVFATSTLFRGDLGGLALADGVCRQLAEKAGLPNFASYTAWLSDSQEDAITRVFWGEGRYVRTDGVTVAWSFVELLQGPLLAPIEIDENGDIALGADAWTGTRPDGTAVPGSTFCDDWTSSDFFDMSGWFGSLLATDTRWTLETNPKVTPTSCTSQYRLYCFEGP